MADKTDLVAHVEARVALMACGRTLEREFPNCLTVLKAYIDQQSALTAQDADEETESAEFDRVVSAVDIEMAAIIRDNAWHNGAERVARAAIEAMRRAK